MTDPDLPSLAVFERLERLANVLRHEQRHLATEHDLKLVQLEALQYLASANRYSDTPAVVAEALQLTKGTVSQTITALVDKGLLRKKADASDGRVVHCELTARGRTIAHAGLPPAVLEGAVAAMPIRQQKALRTSLDDLLGRILEARGYRTFGVCRTCRHFTEEGPDRYRCGLTGDRLLPADSLLRCREHEAA